MWGLYQFQGKASIAAEEIEQPQAIFMGGRPVTTYGFPFGDVEVKQVLTTTLACQHGLPEGTGQGIDGLMGISVFVFVHNFALR